MTIQTERLTLRPFTMRDLKTTHAYASDPDNTPYMLHLPNGDRQATKQFLRAVTSDWEKKPQRRFEFAVELNGSHIGAVSVHLDEDGQQGELGWIIHKAHWGNGYATEAAMAVMGFAREALGVKKLIARCDARNAASARVMEKLGMALEREDGVRYYMGCDGPARELTYSVTQP